MTLGVDPYLLFLNLVSFSMKTYLVVIGEVKGAKKILH